jgi:streptogramin lyase
MKLTACVPSLLTGVALVGLSGSAGAGQVTDPAQAGGPPNSQPNPYRRVDNFLKLPPGRTMGQTSAVALDHAGNIWVADRCGGNSCEGSALDPIMQFDAQGNFIKAFGAGTLLFPHGIYIDKDDRIWITDGHVGGGKGDDVLEFDRTGKLLRRLGKAGVSGDGPDTFHEPNAVLVAANGDIFVSDGHEPGQGNARVVKFDPSGKFILQWGSHGSGPGQFEMPHALGMDAQGRLFVGDRGNNRIQIFDQDGKFLAAWTQFGRPSALYIDANDVIYVADSESIGPNDVVHLAEVAAAGMNGYGLNPPYKRGIRVGSAKTGVVKAFIPDPDIGHPHKEFTSAFEGVWADPDGVIYGAEVGAQTVVRYENR